MPNKKVKSKDSKESPAPHRWTVRLSIAAILVSLASLGLTWANFAQTRKINHTNVRPDVLVAIRHNTLPRWTNSEAATEIVLLNKGPIKATSVYVNYRVIVVDTNLWWPGLEMAYVTEVQNDYKFVLPEIGVGEGRVKSLLGVYPVALYVVDLSYYHPNDMTKYSQRLLFLSDSGRFLDEASFRGNPRYACLKTNIDRRLYGGTGVLPVGKTLTDVTNEALPSYIISVPDDKETPRPLE